MSDPFHLQREFYCPGGDPVISAVFSVISKRRRILTLISRYLILIVLFCCTALQSVSGADAAPVYDANGMKFSYPAGAVIEDQVSTAAYNAVSCRTGDGAYITIYAFNDRTSVDDALKQSRERLVKVFASMKASGIKFTNLNEPIVSTPAKGFLMSFRLRGVSFENITLSAKYPDKVICVTRQYVAGNRAAADSFFQQILSTLCIQ